MSQHWASASKLHILFRCLGQPHLPKVNAPSSEYAADGTAGHTYMEDRFLGLSKAETLAKLPDHLKARYAQVDWEGFWQERRDFIGVKWVAEFPMVFDLILGKTRTTTAGRSDLYGETDEWEIPGTPDLLGLSRDCIWVIDYKTGENRVAPPAKNAQLLLLALAARSIPGRFYAKTCRVVLEVVYIGPHGELESDREEVTLDDLDLFWGTLTKAYQKVEEARPKPSYTTGQHCQYCPSLAFCPAHRSGVELMVKSPEKWVAGMDLSPEERGDAYLRFKEAERYLQVVRQQFFAMAKDAPIPVGNGQYLGPVVTTRRDIDAEKALPVLQKEWGQELAKEALEYSTSQAALARAFEKLVPNEPTSKLVTKAMEELEKAGAVEHKTVTSMKVHRPRKAIGGGQ